MKELMESAGRLDAFLRRIRREIHSNPELSGEEKETAALIVRELEACGGFKIRRNVAGYGVIAELEGGKPGAVIALRADTDALPVAEETGLEFSSRNPGKMHACGHDLHTAMLLGAAKLLAERRPELKGTVRFLFQPAEEDPALGGSKAMIEAGALDRVSAIFGMHVWPEFPSGVFAIRPGEMMAAADHFAVVIKGKSAHGAQPHLGNDALLAGCQFVQAVQTVVSRNVDPFDAAVITVGEFSSGTTYNVLAEECRMEGTVRTYSPEVRDLVHERMKEVLAGICLALGCTGELINISSHPAVINDKTLTEHCLHAAEGIFGKEKVLVPDRPTSISEDFSWYGRKVPSVFGFIGAAKPGQPAWPLHSCHLSPDEDVMVKGAAMYAAFALGI